MASVRYIIAAADGYFPIPEAELERALARITSGPVSPLLFGAYCDLVLDIETDRLDSAQLRVAEIAAAQQVIGAPRIVALRDPADDPGSDRYCRLIDTDPSMPFRLSPPPTADAVAGRNLIAGAMDMLDAGYPALAAELRALLREIVLAAGPGDPDAPCFDGASAFMLWGAIVLNPRANTTTLGMAQALAHESGHNLLFGFCADGPLIENDDTQRFASPLRRDPRPMDGIFHATYVTARMHRAVHRLLMSGVLSAEQRDEAGDALAAHRRAFAVGLETIEAHARFTPRGDAVFSGARDYMAAH